MQLTVNDLFCGGGGMGLGFKQAGFEIVGAWDKDKFAVQSYKENVDSTVVQKDIKDMKWYDLEESDVWAFGFPCTQISRGNQYDKSGLNGKESGMFYEVMRLLKETAESINKLPKVILAENVERLEPLLPIIEEEFDKHGYKMLHTFIDSQDFFLPQHRERYFLVGVRKDLDHTLFSFPEPDKSLRDDNVTIKDILQDGSEIPPKLYLSDKAIEYMGRERNGKPRWYYHKNMVDGVAATITANIFKGVPYGVIQGLPKYRRFSPRECARLQGFPDSYKQVVSDTQFYKQMGNAVSVTVAKAIAQEIKWFLELTPQ